MFLNKIAKIDFVYYVLYYLWQVLYKVINN